MLAIRDLEGLVVIDEVQRAPDLFPVLRVLADRPRTPARFLILGSASPEMLRQSSESLAGRVAYHELEGFSPDEVGVENIGRLWTRGGFPRSFLAASDRTSFEWRIEFIRTFLERDLPQLGITVSATTLRRMWTMLAHSHGQIWNASAFSRSFGLADTTVRRYLDILTSTFVARQLLPWYANTRKRQVKSPKIYLTDSGMLHALLNLEDRNQIEAHPQAGASWEGFAAMAVRQRLEARFDECFFWVHPRRRGGRSHGRARPQAAGFWLLVPDILDGLAPAIRVFDMRDPAVPVEDRALHPVGGAVEAIGVAGSVAYLAVLDNPPHQTGAIEVVNFADPMNPIFMDLIERPGRVKRFAFGPDELYVFGHETGFDIFAL